MKAIRIHAFGGPEVYQYEEVPDPAPGTAQALVAIEAIGVNFIEVYQRTGLYQVPLPPSAPACRTSTPVTASPGRAHPARTPSARPCRSSGSCACPRA